MSQSFVAILSFLGLSMVVYLLIEIGRHTGTRRTLKEQESARVGLGAVEGALFGLMGLLVAFTFSGAASRFDARRTLIVQEANDIGTAWLRLGLLRTNAQPPLRELFRQYLEARLAVYTSTDSDGSAATRAHAISEVATLQGEIWRLAVPAAREAADASAPVLLLPALNEMFDITSTRAANAQFHPPLVIYIMLVILVLTSSLIAGHGMAGSRSRSWMHMIGFSVIMAGTICLIVDLEYPRYGLLRINPADRILSDLRQTLK